MVAMNNFVRLEPQACVYVAICVSNIGFCCSGVILHILLSQLLIIASGAIAVNGLIIYNNIINLHSFSNFSMNISQHMRTCICIRIASVISP